MGDVFELLRRLNKYIDDEKLEKKEAQTPAKLAALRRGVTVFREMGGVMGLFRQPPAEKQPGGGNELVGKLMGLLIELRAESRKKKDFATADQIRKRLAEIGVVLEDRPGGTEWTCELSNVKPFTEKEWTEICSRAENDAEKEDEFTLRSSSPIFLAACVSQAFF